MKLARVIGTVVASVRHPAYDAQTLLLCAAIEPGGAPVQAPAFIAVDRANAGVGDTVLVNDEGNGARQMFGVPAKAQLPIRTVVVGVVDHAEEPRES